MTDGVHFADARLPDGMRLYAIGDVHGCRELLVEMHARIDRQIAREGPADWRIVHVGDYCDRGPDTKGVIDFLTGRMAADPRIVCLRGNHDHGFLAFLASSSPAAARDSMIFIRNGGEATTASYGVAADFSTPDGMARTRDALTRAMPQEHQAFLARLPYAASFGDVFLCHAGIRPGVPLDAQAPDDLIWIRDEFLSDPRLHPKLIVHGHTPSDSVEIRPNRVNVDTRAFASGRLSALVVEGERRTLVEVSGPPR